MKVDVLTKIVCEWPGDSCEVHFLVCHILGIPLLIIVIEML